MFLHLYNVGWRLLSPVIKFYLKRSGKYVSLLGRFFPSSSVCEPVWLHACSVGEVNLVYPLVRLWRDYFPDNKLLLSVSTVTGYEQAKRKYASLCDDVCYCPFDHPEVVKGFFKKVKPRLLILTETEIWPNLVLTAKKENVPVLVINGRISDKAFARYKKIKFIMEGVLREIDFVYTQSEEYAERFRSLGVLPERVQVVGNMKYDAISTEVSPSVKNKIRMDLDILSNGMVIVFGSLREGDEVVARLIWDGLKYRIENLWLILVPRHPDKKGEILNVFSDEKVVLRSENLRGAKGNGRVILVDTIGELVNFYSIASVAVIGGSWFPGVEGHNPLEPAGLGVVPVFGRYMRNFKESAEKLVLGGGAIQLENYREISSVLERLLLSGEYINLGTKAREIVLANQGVSKRILEGVANFL